MATALATILGFLSISSGDKYSLGIEHPEMSQSSSKAPPPSYPEFALRRETISRYFHPPLPRSTFHDFVNKGKIVPMKGIRGFYRLNESLESFQEKVAYGAGALDAQAVLEAEATSGAEYRWHKFREPFSEVARGVIGGHDLTAQYAFPANTVSPLRADLSETAS